MAEPLDPARATAVREQLQSNQGGMPRTSGALSPSVVLGNPTSTIRAIVHRVGSVAHNWNQWNETATAAQTEKKRKEGDALITAIASSLSALVAHTETVVVENKDSSDSAALKNKVNTDIDAYWKFREALNPSKSKWGSLKRTVTKPAVTDTPIDLAVWFAMPDPKLKNKEVIGFTDGTVRAMVSTMMDSGAVKGALEYFGYNGYLGKVAATAEYYTRLSKFFRVDQPLDNGYTVIKMRGQFIGVAQKDTTGKKNKSSDTITNLVATMTKLGVLVAEAQYVDATRVANSGSYITVDALSLRSYAEAQLLQARDMANASQISADAELRRIFYEHVQQHMSTVRAIHEMVGTYAMTPEFIHQLTDAMFGMENVMHGRPHSFNTEASPFATDSSQVSNEVHWHESQAATRRTANRSNVSSRARPQDGGHSEPTVGIPLAPNVEWRIGAGMSEWVERLGLTGHSLPSGASYLVKVVARMVVARYVVPLAVRTIADAVTVYAQSPAPPTGNTSPAGSKTDSEQCTNNELPLVAQNRWKFNVPPFVKKMHEYTQPSWSGPAVGNYSAPGITINHGTPTGGNHPFNNGTRGSTPRAISRGTPTRDEQCFDETHESANESHSDQCFKGISGSDGIHSDQWHGEDGGAGTVNTGVLGTLMNWIGRLGYTSSRLGGGRKTGVTGNSFSTGATAADTLNTITHGVLSVAMGSVVAAAALPGASHAGLCT